MIRPLAAVLALSVQALGQGYICAEGGGNSGKGTWAEEVFGWMVDKGNKGPVVIIGAVPLETDSRIDLFKKLGASAVTPMVVTQESADKQETYDTIAAASVVFIRGGDQGRYVQWWKGTKTQAAIEAVFKKGGVIGGTSAGCAVLGEVDYSALNDSLSPREALADARHTDLTLTTEFLDFVPGVLFDTHFTERGRLARLPVMLAHCKEDLKKPDILGIGVDPRTAICVGPDGVAEVRGEGMATFLRLTERSKIALEKGKPPTVTHIDYVQACAGYRYNLALREFVARPPQVQHVIHEMVVTWHSAHGAVIRGSSAEDSAVASRRVVEKKSDAWLSGVPEMGPGRGELPHFRVTTRAFESPGVGNNMAAQQAEPGVIGLLIDEGCVARVSSKGLITIEAEEGKASSLLLLDFRGTTHGCQPPEQLKGRALCPLEGVTLSVLAPGWTFELDRSKAVAP